jgi:hypothetical protein
LDFNTIKKGSVYVPKTFFVYRNAGGRHMIDRGDVPARLRLFRYGLLVIVIVTFVISLLAPTFALRGLANSGITPPPITDFLGSAVINTIIVGIIMLIAYAVYHYVLTKRWPMMG